MKLVVVGGSGWLGRAVVDRLRQSGHTGSVADIQPPDSLPNGWDWVRCDVANQREVSGVLAGADAVIHMAVATGATDYREPLKPFIVNVLGCYNVLEAARQVNVQRLVLVSSAPVHIDTDDGSASGWRSDPGPDHLYDVTKRLQEELARDFAETFGLSTAVLRAGHVVNGRTGVDSKGRPLSDLHYCRGGWVCCHDISEAVCKAAEGVVVGTFAVVGSRNGRQRFGVAETEDALGFRLTEDLAAYDPE